MTATVRLGTCSFADEGLLRAWYPRGVSTAERRLRYYAERFDVVEVDSPFYALPDPDVTRRWAERTPAHFTFHVKASAAMTFHEGEPTDQAFAEFRGALEPLELSGKLRGVLLQYHPRFVKSRAAKEELARAQARLEPLVPLIEFRHRSWLVEEAFSVLRAHSAAHVHVSSDRLPADLTTTADFVYIRFHGLAAHAGAYPAEALAPWLAFLDEQRGAGRDAYAYFNNDAWGHAPRDAARLRELLSLSHAA